MGGIFRNSVILIINKDVVSGSGFEGIIINGPIRNQYDGSNERIYIGGPCDLNVV